MKKNYNISTKIYLYFAALFILAVASFGIYSFITSVYTLADPDGWDGYTVATSFSLGNGTKENPYIIKDASEYMYFKQLIEGDNSFTYSNLYYSLGNDIDFNQNAIKPIGIIEGEEERIFAGHFDGAGYALKNFKIVEPVVFSEESYYSLFTKTKDASIERLTVDNYRIEVEDSENKIVVSPFIGINEVTDTESGETLSVFQNIILLNFNIDFSKVTTADNYIYAFMGDANHSKVHNVSLDGEITSNLENQTLTFFGGEELPDITNFVNHITLINSPTDLENIDIPSYFYYHDDHYYQQEDVITDEALLAKLNENMESPFYWDYVDNHFVLCIFEEKVEDVPVESKSFNFSIRKAASITLHDTGYSGTSLYLNDLTSDYNHYLGMNYTFSANSTIPDGQNHNLYGDTNLAKVYMVYDSHDVNDNTIYGQVSNTEAYDKIYYYKYYPIVNGNVTFTLIDNPWAKRPTGKAFNGWVTDYPNAVIQLDMDYYERTVTIPASAGETISIEFKTSWTDATTVTSTSFTNLKSRGMEEYPNEEERIYEDMSVYYVQKTLARYSYFPNDVDCYHINGQHITPGSRCTTRGGCPYLTLNDTSDYVQGTSYYELTFPNPPNAVVRSHTPIYTLNITPYFDSNQIVAGNYQRVTVYNGGSVEGLYDGNGNLMHGNCSGTCNYYKLLQYYDEYGNVNYAQGTTQYYYLVTRDTNIMILSGTHDGFSITKPVTITGINGNNNTGGTIRLSWNSMVANADARIEHLNITTDTSASASLTSSSSYVSTDALVGNYFNFKVGRGISQASNRWMKGVWGGTFRTSSFTKGSASDPYHFSLIIESGKYNNIYQYESTGARGTLYVYSKTYLGCDIDRALNDNDNLNVYYSFQGHGGTVTVRGNDNTSKLYDIYVRSGSFGTSKNGLYSGIYVGGRGATIYGYRRITVEGGYIYNIIGGLGSVQATQDLNSVDINVKGGSVDVIFASSGSGATYGNRVVNATGGVVNNNIFGGSNGSTITNSSSDTGVLYGDTFIYVGGNCKVGGAANALFGAEIGSVFGVGNGNTNKDGLGAADNSNVIIDGQAEIAGNVYGGGNYGSVGAQSSSNTSTTNIQLLGGTINGNVYGGGNNNGSGSTSVTSTVNITMTNGVVKGSVYGGSNSSGIIYGSVNVNINGGEIDNDVYGGGEGGYTSNNSNYTRGTFVRDNVSVTVLNGLIKGSVYGGSAYGTVNAASYTATTAAGNTIVTIEGGTIQQNVFGGGKGSSSFTPRVVGNVTVMIDGGSIGSVFGGNDAAGQPGGTDIVYLNGGVIGNAYGGGNNTGQNATDIRLQGSTITGNLYGGSNLLGTVNTSQVTVKSGSVVDIYGGNNLDGLTRTTIVNVNRGNIQGDIYGGGNQAETTTTNVYVNGLININNVYGGGNQAGVSNSTNVNIAKGTINGVYGGSNLIGTVGTTNVTVEPDTSNYYDDYTSGGSGLEVSFNYRFSSAQYQTDLYPEYQTIVDVTPVFRNTTGEDYDEWAVILTIPDSTFFVHDGDANIIVNGETYIWNQDDRWWGTNPIPAGSTYSPSLPLRVLFKGTEDDFRLIYDLEAIDGNNGFHKKTNDPNYVSPTQGGGIDIETIYGGNNLGGTVNVSNVTINNGTIGEIYGGGNQVGLTTSNVEITGGNITSVYGGANINGNVTTSNVTIGGENTINITNVYGGNNLGGTTTNTNVTTTSGTIGTIYGGGKSAGVGTTRVSVTNTTATDIYGGGDAAGVSANTLLDINSSTVINNIYGGGNEGVVDGSTLVYVTDSHIQGNAFAGGNGSTAVVAGNSTITIDGSSEIGTATSVAPNDGCVFGSGNAASTGLAANGGSISKVNIVGGKIHGNVYGGPKMAVVYGITETNIGTSAVILNGLVEDDIVISGTVFGGGESNASGSTTYDWTFISVTEGITVNIDGSGYESHSHDFVINGSIFGSGNASSSSGTSNVNVKNLGTFAHPNVCISIQRANNLVIDSSVIELYGTTDRTNEYSDIDYSLNIIDHLILKNNSTLMMHHNANLLKEFYSGVDTNNGLVPATVNIDDDNGTVTKNVDNRIYMIPGQNLNVTVNQAATSYGRVTGMTFFGMYQAFDNGTYRFGLYDPAFSYGDSGNASLEIIGGSYVVGLRNVNHDITKDGFYSNQLDEETFTSIETYYIDPSPIGETGYRWIIGFEAINYEFTLTASKYSSLGTYELQLIDFADGDTTFTVLGFDSSGLNPDVSLIDSNLVPRIGQTPEEANSVLGLSMKAETQEWMSYGVTKLISDGDGDTLGDDYYRTDSRAVAPSLMFYLYHTKNIDLQANLGTVVLTLQAAVPINAIDDDITFITVTINLVARKYNDGDSYDASITYDRKYEMPSSTLVNITNQSQFTAYFSMILSSPTFESVYGRNNDYYHVITSNYVLPLNTMITMLDFGANDDRPNYYYFRVTQAVYDDSVQQMNQYNEVSYRLDQFILMDSTSTNNTYDDSIANQLYYDSDSHFADEEFIFIFDFKETTTTGDHLNNNILFELRDNEDRTKLGVLGIREDLMFYNTYESSNVVLNQTIQGTDSYLYYNIADEFSYATEIQYNETENRESVIDTNYESSSMGLNVIFLDMNDDPVSSSLLIGTSIFVGNQEYFADGDGIFRIKLSNKVSNLNRNMRIVANKNLPAGQYKVRYVLFASDDGLHNSQQENSVTQQFNVTVVSADNSITVDCDDLTKVVNGETGLNLAGSRINTYDVKYESQLTNPNFRVEIYKRKVTSIDAIEYDSVPFSQLFTNNMTVVSGNEVSFTMSDDEESLDFQLQSSLTSGTYKVVFKLYDGNQLIDEEIKYVIVKKNLT